LRERLTRLEAAGIGQLLLGAVAVGLR